jgi:hypothetical protein
MKVGISPAIPLERARMFIPYKNRELNFWESLSDFQIKKSPKLSCGVGAFAHPRLEQAKMPIPLLWLI